MNFTFAMQRPDHPFDQAIALEPIDADQFVGRTSDNYWNFVSPYGGITAATIVNALLRRSERSGEPLSLTVSFCGPLQAGEFRVATRLVRSNRSTQHWSVQLTQGEEVAATAIAVFAARRSTWRLTEAAPPEVPQPEAIERVQSIIGLKWVRMYEMRYARGRFMQENDDSITYSWIRDATPRALDYPAVTAMCDAFFPRLFLRRPKIVPIATVSLNIYFHADAEALARHGTERLLGVAQGRVFNQGFFDQEGQLWGAGNQLLATTHQVVWFKE